MPESDKIKLHDARSFTATYMPSEELRQILKDDISRYFIVRIEEMYRHVRQNVPASRSTSHTAMYITAGEAIMKIGSEQYKIQKDEMLFVPAGQVFSFEPYHINQGFLFVFDNDLLISKFSTTDPLKDFDFLNVWGNPHIKLNETVASFVLHILNRLSLDYAENGLKNTGIIQSYLLALLHEIKGLSPQLPTTKQHAAAHITNRFKELLFAKIKSNHLVTDYASLLNITPNHLNKTIKAFTGKSPTKWIDETLVAESKVLLLQSDLSINEIALEIGFEDPSYFTRLFKKYEGITPGAFRKMIDKS